MMLFRLRRKSAAKKRIEWKSFTQWSAQVNLIVAEETRAETPISSESHSIAAAAIRVRHRGNHTDGAARAAEPEVAGGPVSTRRTDSILEWTNLLQRSQHFIGWHDMIPGQLSHLSDRHQLDESHVPLVVDRETRKIADLVVIDAAHYHDVDLDRRQPRVLRRRRGSNRIEVEIAPG